MIVESIGDIIKLSGDLVSNQWETIRTAAGLILKRHPEGVIVDCEGITSCTPQGADTFYDMMLHIEKKKAHIIVANLPAVVKEALSHVPEVRSRLAIASSVEEARRSLELQSSISDKSGRGHHATGVLILALCGSGADPYATVIAAALAQLRQLKVHAMFPILVPQALPMTTPMPERETAAESALHRAREMLTARNVPVELQIERSRSLASAIERIAAEIDERTAIISLPDEDHRTGEPAKTADDLIAKITSEVILVRKPLS